MMKPEAEALTAELLTHGKTCRCAHKKMCEDREEWLRSELITGRVSRERVSRTESIAALEQAVVSAALHLRSVEQNTGVRHRSIPFENAVDALIAARESNTEG